MADRPRRRLGTTEERGRAVCEPPGPSFVLACCYGASGATGSYASPVGLLLHPAVVRCPGARGGLEVAAPRISPGTACQLVSEAHGACHGVLEAIPVCVPAVA